MAISPQCGFASTDPGNLLTEDEQWRKGFGCGNRPQGLGLGIGCQTGLILRRTLTLGPAPG